jgi:penicillin-binding protein 1C
VPAKLERAAAAVEYRLLQPTAGLLVAHDPRIPAELEALPMQVAPVPGLERVEWFVDGKLVSSGTTDSFPWPLQHGTHSVHARIWSGADSHETNEIRFHVN